MNVNILPSANTIFSPVNFGTPCDVLDVFCVYRRGIMYYYYYSSRSLLFFAIANDSKGRKLTTAMTTCRINICIYTYIRTDEGLVWSREGGERDWEKKTDKKSENQKRELRVPPHPTTRCQTQSFTTITINPRWLLLIPAARAFPSSRNLFCPSRTGLDGYLGFFFRFRV